MREIKFRVWDKKKKVMIPFGFNNLSGWDDCCVYLPNAVWLVESDNESLNPDLEIMQYTGLKDKNGKGIYEGDILSGLAGEDGNVEPLLGVVIWDNGMFILKVISTPEKYYLTTNVFNRTIVRGNIHENPELLPTD